MPSSTPYNRRGDAPLDVIGRKMWLPAARREPPFPISAFSKRPAICAFRQTVPRVISSFAALSLLLIALTGCGASASNGRSADGVPSAVNLKFLKRTLVDAEGEEHRYVVFVPLRENGGPKPAVLLFLNGRGQNGEDGMLQIAHQFGAQFWECRGFSPFLGIAPPCRNDGVWTADSPDTHWALQILDEAVREFDGDPDRVYLTGVSTGGAGVWSVASAYPERFAAIVPMSAGGGADAEKLAASGMPIWNFWNSRDRPHIVQFNRNLKLDLIQRGSSPLFTEYPAGGPDCWNRAYSTSPLYAWLLQQNRASRQNASKFQQFRAEQLKAEWRPSQEGAWRIAADDVLMGRTRETGRRGRLDAPECTSSWEFHGEVQLRNNSPCELLLSSELAVGKQTSYLLSIVSPELGAGGLTNDEDRRLARIDPAAQHALRIDDWNDIRVKLLGSKLSLHLNGWPAIETKLPLEMAFDQNLRLAILTPSDGREIQWRLIRTRFDSKAPSVAGGRGQ